MAGVLLRLVFAAIFGTTGFLLGREAYDRAISIHIASQWWQFAAVVIAPVVGALLGVLVVPMAQRVFDRELLAVERAIDRMAPGELVGGAIGLTGGLIIAFLAKSVLFEFITFAGRTGGYIAIVHLHRGEHFRGVSRRARRRQTARRARTLCATSRWRPAARRKCSTRR